MRTLWNIVAFLSVVNLLALSIGVGWLWWSGRFDEERFAAAKAIFELPIAAVEVSHAAAVAQNNALEAAVIEERRWGQIPASSIHAIDAAERWTDLGVMMQARLETQATALAAGINASLFSRTTLLDAREAILVERENKLQARFDRQRDEDFQAMVASVSELRDSDAFAILMSYIRRGSEDVVVSVLASLEVGRRTELIGEFIDEGEADLAGRLLLELRDQGQETSEIAENLIAANRSDANSTRPSRRDTGS